MSDQIPTAPPNKGVPMWALVLILVALALATGGTAFAVAD